MSGVHDLELKTLALGAREARDPGHRHLLERGRLLEAQAQVLGKGQGSGPDTDRTRGVGQPIVATRSRV